MRKMHIAFFGSSLVSSYWNGAATYYRGLLKALNQRGYKITFYEPDAYDRQRHRDIPDPDWARVEVYSIDTVTALEKALEEARYADLIVKASGVGVFDTFLDEAVLSLRDSHNMVAFWDVDAPATLARVHADVGDHFRALIPRYDLVFTYGGGDSVVHGYMRLGARICIPIYNALDPSTHYPVPPIEAFAGDIGFVGNRLPDRESRVNEFFFGTAQHLPNLTFVLGGNGWTNRPMPPNVRYLGHVYTYQHNTFNCSQRAVLNINRQSMADCGFSPPTRVFEVAGAAGCLITDDWPGIEMFLEPEAEVIVAKSAEEMASHIEALSQDRARQIGRAALRRVLAQHTYAHRAVEVERALGVHN